MLGRVRASSTISLEQLEMERTSSKIIKHDSLSIYEATLLKLKQGSHCKLDDSAKMDAHFTMASEEEMTTDADCSSADNLPNSSHIFQSRGLGSVNDPKNKNMSILYFFKKCNGSQHAQDSNHKEEEMMIDYSSSSSSVSSTSSS